MSKAIHRKKRTSRPLDRLIGRYASRIRFAGAKPHLDIYKFKTFTPPENQFRAHRALFPSETSLDVVHGSSFPASVSDLFAKPALYEASPVIHEIIWAICRVLSSAEKIRHFVVLRDLFERSVVSNKRNQAEDSLFQIEKNTGQSLWLIQNKLSTVFAWQGLDEMWRLAATLSDEAGPRSLTAFLVSFVAMRTESAKRKEAQRNDLQERLKRLELENELKQYLLVKLFGFHDISIREAGAVLLFDAQSSLIDHYDALVAVLQSAVTNRAIAPKAIKILEKPVVALYKATQDRRLRGVMRSLAYSVEEHLSADRAAIVESYTAGRYEVVLAMATDYLQSFPDDLAIFILKLRACVRNKVDSSSAEGVLGEVANHMFELFKESPAAYQSAFSVLTLADRFYAQSWMQYVRAIVIHELETEISSFPSRDLRRVYVLDPLSSPFSAVAFVGKQPTDEQEDDIAALYPLTALTYAAAAGGSVPRSGAIAPDRLRKYLAKHALSSGDLMVARDHYEWLLKHSRDHQKLRSAAGASLTYMKLGMLEEATTTLIDAYLGNRSLPSVLPIKEVTTSLNQPSSWPDSVVVPLLFELYVTYCNEDGIAKLRYSFEKFLVENNIQEPKDLVPLIGRFGTPAIIAFLDDIWRPEVMRQTVLYSGTKEIEDARIKACKVLADIDPAHAAIHLEEVKERVKQLEIAKGTTLIEQSKVHVDIDAIRRSLRRTLGDSYARYKSSSQSIRGKYDDLILDLVEVIAKSPGVDERSVPRLLSQVHLLDSEVLSESDVQFSAIFSEVTNEFLFGDHGLNAYLSTCVRHGTLSNTLRKPVADEGIVTARETSGAYSRNTRWSGYGHEVWRDSWKRVLDALDAFSSEFDAIIDRIKDELLQIRVVSGRPAPAEKQDALFIYASSNLERKYVQNFDRGYSNMDDFVSYCVNTLWDKTDANLLAVQLALDGEVRGQIARAFDRLENAIRPLDSIPGVSELINAVARARTSTQNKLNTVISWFKRSEVYDRPDYVADFPAQIALNMIKSTISSASNWSGVTINRAGGEEEMPGRTLDAMVYIFYDLIANALTRSGLAPEQLSLSIHIQFERNRFRSTVINNVDPSKATVDERKRVRAHSESIFRPESARRAQSEKNSGLHKVWIALNAPIYNEPRLKFDLLETSFVVEIEFTISVGAYENTLH